MLSASELIELGISSYACSSAVGGDFRLGDDFKLRRPSGVFDLIDKTAKLGPEVLQICENVSFQVTAQDYRRLGEVAESKGVTLELGTAGLGVPIIDKYVQIAELTSSHLLRAYPTHKEPPDKIVKNIQGYLPVLQERELTLAIEDSSLYSYSCHQLAQIFGQLLIL